MFGSNLNENEQAVITKAFQMVGQAVGAERDRLSAEIIKAVETPLRKVLLSGDIQSDIFSTEDYSGVPVIMYDIDMLTPGDEAEFYAYVKPGEGYIPQRRVESDYLMIPTYQVANAIDINLRILRDARWNVIARMLEILNAGFIKKMNDDGWQVLLAAAVDRNIMVSDPSAAAGQFTPRLITLLQTIMRRNGGGNSNTMNRSKLTDVYLSPEAQADIFTWNLDLIPDSERAKIYNSDINSPDTTVVYGTRLHVLDELGEGQDYQTYFTSTLAGSMAAGDLEIVVGLDRQRNDSFVRPMKEPIKIFEDPNLHRHQAFGMYGWGEFGFAVLDSRRTLLGSL